jgi:toxin HigB-1
MIRSFRGKETERIWHGQSSRKLPGGIEDRALRKLRHFDAASALEDLRNPPGNRLEVLKGDRAGQMSIASTSSGAFAFDGRRGTHSMWTSSIIIESHGNNEG